MDSDVEARGDRLENKLDDIRDKFADLAGGPADLSQGYRTIAEGLGLLIDELATDTPTHQARLEVVLAGLETLADLMDESGPGPADSDTIDSDKSQPDNSSQDVADPAAQFREMFRTEARKRLSGLSISMMGIFSERASQDALAQTNDHLHAMKGAASMVGLSDIAELVGAMEQIVVEMKRQSPEERTWPTRALMRGFHLLEQAASDEALALDEELASDVIHTLKAYRTTPETNEQRARAPGDTQPLEALPRRDTSSTAARFADYDGPLEKRILIVDDIETIAASVGFVLSELDVPIDMAEHGEEALEMLKTRPFSLVVSDVSMPRMDGVALTRMMQNDEHLSDIPVVLLTSLDRPDERAAGIEAGATDYIIKGSIGGGELLNRVRELLELAPDVPAGALPTTRDRFRILIAEDVETIAASIAFVLSEGPFEIDIARNGAKALARLREESYDLLLSDVQMPEMGGLELLGEVRGDDRLSTLPVILLTSLQNPDVQEQALEAGANRFLIKGEIAGATLRQVIEETAKPDGA
jgi:CheY-like chemotaxis protein/HPt (histidine-containing phosphotransfer) domain-containing protein